MKSVSVQNAFFFLARSVFVSAFPWAVARNTSTNCKSTLLFSPFPSLFFSSIPHSTETQTQKSTHLCSERATKHSLSSIHHSRTPTSFSKTVVQKEKERFHGGTTVTYKRLLYVVYFPLALTLSNCSGRNTQRIRTARDHRTGRKPARDNSPGVRTIVRQSHTLFTRDSTQKKIKDTI